MTGVAGLRVGHLFSWGRREDIRRDWESGIARRAGGWFVGWVSKGRER